MNDLVRRLSEEQPIELGYTSDVTTKRLKEALDRGYALMNFVRTGTNLGVRLEKEACDLAGADFAAGTGKVKVVGGLVLNYNRVRFLGELDLGTLKGTGRLEFVAEVKPGEV